MQSKGGFFIMGLIVLAIVIIGYHLLKDAADSAEMRAEARRRGWDYYTSRTGLRWTDTNEKYFGSKRYYDQKYKK